MPERGFLVTGASRGLGLAFSRHYLEAGGRVVACARSSTEHTQALASAYGDRFRFLELDLLEAGVPEELARTASVQLGRIDVLVNNAAAAQDSLLVHTPPDEIARLVDLNVTATILVTRAVVRSMLLAGGGAILNVSSVCALRGYAGLTVYSATKGALDALTRSMARELGSGRIRVNSVAPGFFESEMSSVLTPAQVDAIRRRTPTGSLVSAEEVVRACDSLVAPDSTVSGHVLVVDGGSIA
jgi:3-oxoacyl-[acyl-carrier protein] reductase